MAVGGRVVQGQRMMQAASDIYLGWTINTVKTHLKSIFRKLAAAHRGEAVRRGRQLNLI